MTTDGVEPGAGDGPVVLERSRAFIQAVAWGEHYTVWDLMSTEARRTVLRVATDRGMDDALAARLREGTATESERDEFLTDLVNGLRTELEGTDIDHLEYHADPAPEAGRSTVIMAAPMPAGLSAGLPVGSVELVEENGKWLVERLLPRPGRWSS